MSEHADIDTLSAFLDGEGTGDVDISTHVQGCATCRAKLDSLRAARDAVAAPVPPLATPLREQAIAQALAAAPPAPASSPPPARPRAASEPPAVVALPPRRPLRPGHAGGRWWLGGSAAAAVLVLVVGIVALVGRGSSSNQNTALSAQAPSASGSAPVAAGAAGASGAEKSSAGSDGVVDAGNLGDVADVNALRSRVNAGVTAAASAAAPAAAPGIGNDAVVGPTAPVPRQVGTRVCEVEARTARPQLGVVVYSATARFAGIPAQVLGFGVTPGARPMELLVLAPQDGCRILAETTIS